MLQCSGCGDLVSEFAARCPACGRSVEDALEVEDSLELQEEEQPAEAADEPSADPVRRGRSRHGPVMVTLTILVAVVAVIVGVLASSTGRSAPSSLKNLVGEVLVQSRTGEIWQVDPSTGRMVRRPLFDRDAVSNPVAVSADGTTLVASNGNEVTVDAGRVTTRPTTVGRLLSTVTSPAGPSAFSDLDRALLLLTRPTTGPSRATLVGLADGRQVDVGIVDSAGADPQSLGAFVSVPSQPTQANTAHPGGPDVAVELRVAGKPPSILATATELNRDVGWPATTPVQLNVYPNSTGTAISVVLNPLNARSRDVPMVVLDRQGGVLAVLGDQLGPVYGGVPAWSPGGYQVAFPTSTISGIALGITTETGALEALRPPTPVTTLTSCLWSPNSTYVLCQGRTPTAQRWLYATPTVDRLIPAPSPGAPVAWVTAVPAP